MTRSTGDAGDLSEYAAYSTTPTQIAESATLKVGYT